MKCIILAAGYATRLYPLTQNFPKPLLKVGKKTIIDWLVDDASPDIDEFVIVTNHRFFSHFEKWADLKEKDHGSMEAVVKDNIGVDKGRTLHITVLDDGTESNETRLGAVKDIQFAVDRLKIDDDCFVMAGDNVLDFSLRGFIQFARAKGTSCVMCHEENRLEALRKTAVIKFDQDGLISSYEEKPQNPKGNYAVPPFYYYRAADIKRIPEALNSGCGYDAPGSFAAWLSAQTPMHAYIMPGKRYDIGDLQSYQHVQEIYKNI